MAGSSIATAVSGASALQRERFLAAIGSRGPHPVPRARQISRPFHRLFSVKAGMRPVACDAALVADAVLMTEGDPEVRSLCERPLRIEGPIGNEPYVTFDLGLTTRTGVETLYRVVPEALLAPGTDGRRLPAHWTAVEPWCAEHGHRCDVLTAMALG